MIIIPFEPEHLKTLTLQKAQEASEELMRTAGYGEALKATGPAWSLFDEENLTCVLAGGMADVGAGRAVVWMLVSPTAGKNLGRVMKFARRTLEGSGFRRVEAVVAGSFKEGHRLAKLMGFNCETPDGMKQYYADGGTAYLYSWLKNG